MKGLKLSSILCLILAIALLLPSFFPPLVREIQAEETMVSVNAPEEVFLDSHFVATVDISGVENFDAANYDISFDYSLLELKNVTPGEIEEVEIPINVYEKLSSGTVQIIQNVPGVGGVSGSGYLAKLHFHVISSACDTTEITLSNGVLSNNKAEEIPVEEWSGSSVKVIASFAPLIFDLSPANNAHTSSTDVLFTWRTSVESSSELFIKTEGETDYTQIAGNPGVSHAVIATNLTRNTGYDFYVRSESDYGATESEMRRIFIDNGNLFSQRTYTFTIERDYDQRVAISVQNTDDEPHQLLLSVSQVPEDLAVGFVGEGSMDQTILLHAGEQKNALLVIHAQDAATEDYTLLLNLTNLGAEEIVDTAYLQIHVHIPVIVFTIEEVSTDPNTLTKTVRITNNGDPLTDLNISVSGELTGKVMLQPSINHGNLGTGKSIEFKAIPILSEDYSGVSGSIIATAAGAERSLTVDFNLPEGNRVFIGHCPSMSIEFAEEFDNDGIANTNPDATVVNSYEIITTNRSGLAFIAQVMVKVTQNGEPAYQANVVLDIQEGEGSSTSINAITDLWGQAIFTIVGPEGEYLYQAHIAGYPAYTATRTFTLNSKPVKKLEPESIEWISAADSNQTYELASGEDVALNKPIFTFRARKNNIPENSTPVMFLQVDSKNENIEVIGTVEGDELVFRLGAMTNAVYTATIALQSDESIATSETRRFIFTPEACDMSYATEPDDAIFNGRIYKFPFPIDADNMAVMEVNTNVIERSQGKIVCFLAGYPQDKNNSVCTFSYLIISDQTMDDTLTINVRDSNDNMLYQYSGRIHLEEFVPEFIDIPVPVYNESGNRISEFAIEVMTGDRSHIIIDTVESWTTGQGEVFNGQTWQIFWQNGVLTIHSYVGVVVKCGASFVPWVGEAMTAIDTINSLTTHNYAQGAYGGGQLVANAAEHLAGSQFTTNALAIYHELNPTNVPQIPNFQQVEELLQQNVHIENLGATAHYISYASNIYSNIGEWQRVSQEQEPNQSGVTTSYQMNDWYCTNRPKIGVGFNIPNYFVPENVYESYALFHFTLPWSESLYRPHDVQIMMNGNEIGNLMNTIPNGHYIFPFEPSLLNYAESGVASNQITLNTIHLNSGHYVASSDFTVVLALSQISIPVVASSYEKADEIVSGMADTVARQADAAIFTEDITFSDSNPEAGDKVTIEARIYNLGSVDMTGVGVQILDGDTEIVSLRIPYLPRFNSQTLSTTWQVPLGSVHNITVKVNPDRSIEESNYSNNEATRGISVRTPDTIETRATLRGKVTLQGRPESPAPAWIILLTVTLYNPGVSEPVATYEVPTTNKGEFELVGIISATYDIEVKGLYTLSNVKREVSLPTGTTVDFGTLLEGDCNGDNIILGGDFSLLRTCYGKTSENDGFDSRCDLNQDGVISGADFSLLRTNYYQYGPVELS